MNHAARSNAEECPAGGERPLTRAEIALARSIFGDEIDYAKVMIRRWKWFPFQPRKVVMAPRGHLHFHPSSADYCRDFGQQGLTRQGLFIHEMAHVWQSQKKGRWYLVLRRHPWCRYHYTIRPGWPLGRYGIEQQAEIIRHAFILRNGGTVTGVADQKIYTGLVNFPGAR